MSWTQAMCVGCWEERHPDRPAGRGEQGPDERCSYCGESTRSGIYVREDPATVAYPREES
jgi:hypothetical protein